MSIVSSNVLAQCRNKADSAAQLQIRWLVFHQQMAQCQVTMSFPCWTSCLQRHLQGCTMLTRAYSMHAGVGDEAGLGQDAVQEPGIADGDAHAAGGGLSGATLPLQQTPPAEEVSPVAAGPLVQSSEASVPEASAGAEDRKRHAAASEGEGGPRKQPYYFEFAKKRWESEETFRLPDGSFWPQARRGAPSSPPSPLPLSSSVHCHCWGTLPHGEPKHLL